MIILALALAVITAPEQCVQSYRDLLAYQSEANGAVINRTVDHPGGTIEYLDSQNLLREIDLAVQPFAEELRVEALNASPDRCEQLSRRGRDRIRDIIFVAFPRQ